MEVNLNNLNTDFQNPDTLGEVDLRGLSQKFKHDFGRTAKYFGELVSVAKSENDLNIVIPDSGQPSTLMQVFWLQNPRIPGQFGFDFDHKVHVGELL